MFMVYALAIVRLLYKCKIYVLKQVFIYVNVPYGPKIIKLGLEQFKSKPVEFLYTKSFPKIKKVIVYK